eukprot:Skav229451  [mRNA]  locus=scaffold397:278040:279268:- [translate_table: standard]
MAMATLPFSSNIAPTFATIDGKATILSNSISFLHSFGTHKVRHGLACLRAELDILGFCWLEEHVAMTIAIQFTSCISSCSHIVSAIQVGLGNLLDGIPPCVLGSFHLLLVSCFKAVLASDASAVKGTDEWWRKMRTFPS